MNFEEWICGCLVTVFPWIDGKHIYYNVQHFAPGSSLSQPPQVDKTVYITDDEAGRRMIREYPESLVNFVLGLTIPDGEKFVITAAD